MPMDVPSALITGGRLDWVSFFKLVRIDTKGGFIEFMAKAKEFEENAGVLTIGIPPK
jgi:hypothetical protein